jgi:hypothetical protein
MGNEFTTKTGIKTVMILGISYGFYQLRRINIVFVFGENLPVYRKAH